VSLGRRHPDAFSLFPFFFSFLPKKRLWGSWSIWNQDDRGRLITLLWLGGSACRSITRSSEEL